MSIFSNCHCVEGTCALNISNWQVLTSTFNFIEQSIKQVTWKYTNFQFHVSTPSQVGSYAELSNRILESSFRDNLYNIDNNLTDPEYLSSKVIVNIRGMCHGSALSAVERLKQDPNQSLTNIFEKCNPLDIFYYSVLDYLRYECEKEIKYNCLESVRKLIPAPNQLAVNRELSLEWLCDKIQRLSSDILLIRCWTEDLQHAHTFTVRIVNALGFFEMYDSNPGMGIYSYPNQKQLIGSLQSLFEAHYPYFLKDAACELSIYPHEVL